MGGDIDPDSTNAAVENFHSLCLTHAMADVLPLISARAPVTQNPRTNQNHQESGRYWDRTSDNLLVREVLYR